MKKLLFAASLILWSRAALAESAFSASSAFQIPGVYWLILIAVALIAAFIVVSVMKDQLKTASSQTHAENYIREDSFRLDIERDQFLYETVERRKIETNEDKEQ